MTTVHYRNRQVLESEVREEDDHLEGRVPGIPCYELAIHCTQYRPITTVPRGMAVSVYGPPDHGRNAGNATFEMIIFFAHFGLQDPVGFGNEQSS